MELQKVLDSSIQNELINRILKTLVSDEDFQDLSDGIFLSIEDGSNLYSIVDGDSEIGFLIVTPLSDDASKKIDILSVDEIWIKSGNETNIVSDAIGHGLQKLQKEFKAKKIELVISRDNEWIGKSLQEYNLICSEIKLEKVLPNPNNLGDVLELIQDCTPIDRIVQVLLEKEDELRAEIIEAAEEIDNLLEEDWIPVIVVVTFEPDGLQISEILNSSNQIIKWDDFSLLYRS